MQAEVQEHDEAALNEEVKVVQTTMQEQALDLRERQEVPVLL